MMKLFFNLFKTVFIPAVLIAVLVSWINAAEANEQVIDLDKTFSEHGAVMLFIEQGTGRILYANEAAVKFYGYTKEQLTSMPISQINMVDPSLVAEKTQAAAREERNLFMFQHRLASGELRWVEVHAYPAAYQGRQALFSVIHDITPEVLLQKRHQQVVTVAIVTCGGFIAILLLLLWDLRKKARSLTKANGKLAYYNALRKTFMDADTDLIYLKDEQLRYVFANKALQDFFQLPEDKVVGYDDASLLKGEFAEMCAQADWDALKNHQLITSITSTGDRFFRTTKFPVPLPNGAYGVGAYISDITEEHKWQQSREQHLKHQKLLLEMLSRSFESKQEQLDYALHELLKITDSQYGYIYFYNEDKKEFILNSWTKGVMEECTVPGQPKVYSLGNTGIWGEVVRQRKPIIVNGFQLPNLLKKGYPAGHVELKKFMSFPVIIDDRIVAVVGFANKQTDYDETDVDEMTMLMAGVWNAVQRRESAETLVYERNRYYQTLLSIGDGVMVIDNQENIEVLNAVASRLTGWSQEEAAGMNYKQVFHLSHEQEGFTIDNPIEKVFATGQPQELGNHAILTSRDGTKYHLEDSAAPVLDDRGQIAGVVLVFRDVTEKREQRKKIEYMSFHDSLTGLYNRRFLEEELHRLDTERNLPISIIMGDVNSLKLTNDIFGHAFGDMLLERVAEVMRHVCRADDIIARWGGDEFLLLLPKTSLAEAENIANRIKKETYEQQIRAIKCSISTGCDTKRTMEEDIIQTLNRAEAKMYAAKTLGRDDLQSRELSFITNFLYQENQSEERHARRVSKLCGKMGLALELPGADILLLREAGRLHDIGKIVFSPDLLNKGSQFDLMAHKKTEQHPIIGSRILSYFDETHQLAEAVLNHHENWDGSGYPKGLKGEEIHLFARIISVVDAYDHLLHPHCKASTMGKDEALQEIGRRAGTLFDPHIAKIFISLLQHAEGDVFPQNNQSD